MESYEYNGEKYYFKKGKWLKSDYTVAPIGVINSLNMLLMEREEFETKTVDDSQRSVTDKSLDDTTILMSINGTIGNLAYYSGEKLMLGKSAAYIKVSEFDKKFVYAYLQAPSVQAYFMDSLTGTTIKNLGLKAIREMKIIVPQDIEEQNKIGEFFYNLDKLITFHQCKLDKLKRLKEALLRAMFAA